MLQRILEYAVLKIQKSLESLSRSDIKKCFKIRDSWEVVKSCFPLFPVVRLQYVLGVNCLAIRKAESKALI